MEQTTKKSNNCFSKKCTQYMKDCGINSNDVKPIDVELLSIFIENMYSIKLSMKRCTKYKYLRFSTNNDLLYVFTFNNGKKSTILKVDKQCNVFVNSTDAKEINAIEDAFKRWCDIIQFEKYREEK